MNATVSPSLTKAPVSNPFTFCGIATAKSMSVPMTMPLVSVARSLGFMRLSVADHRHLSKSHDRPPIEEDPLATTTLTRVCSEDECNRSEQLRRGMCQMHYARWKTSGGSGRICGQAACSDPHYAKDLCAKHYIRLRTNGDPCVVGIRGDGRKPAGEQHYKWTGDDASYGAVPIQMSGPA